MIFCSSCVLMTFVCNDRMSDTVDQMVDTSKGILNEAIFFINRTVGVRKRYSQTSIILLRPQLPRFLNYADLLLWSQFVMNINKSYFVSAAKLFSLQISLLCDEIPVQIESVNCFKAQICVHFVLIQAKAIYMNP